MDYAAFCAACDLRPVEADAFEKFACVGGIPKYWEFVEAGQDAVALAESLYFDYAPYMEQEPQRILRDEGVIGLNALAVLEAVGRGAERPSEIARCLGTAQTNLSRLLQLERKWAHCSLRARWPKVRFDVIDAGVLGVWVPKG
jgi:hypothetical protein